MAARGEGGHPAHDAHLSRGSRFQAKVLRDMPNDDDGLSEAAAAERLIEFGPNALWSPPPPSFLRRFLAQFADVTVLALLVAAGVAVGNGISQEARQPFVSRFGDAMAIGIIVLLNAIIGLLQERRAETALAALKELSAPTSRVRRDGVERIVPSRELVPGDVVLLREGDRVPADLRLTQTVGLSANEASLTGESEAVEKSASSEAPADAPLAERANMTFAGTHVVSGRGVGIVAATGMRTELGRIAEMLATVEAPETPLQQQLRRFGTRLVLGCVVIAALVFVVGIWRMEESISVMFMTAVSLAVAAIPEGLPAVTTIVLALGVERMAKRRAVVRRLSSVETLGAVDVICTDKTGTLTQNRMTVRRVSTLSTALRIEWEPSGSAVALKESGDAFVAEEDSAVSALVFACSLPRSARIVRTPESGSHTIGSSSEGALLMFAEAIGAPAGEPLIDAEIPFDRARGMASVTVRDASGSSEYHHGVPEHLIQRATGVLDARGSTISLTEESRRRLLLLVDAWGRQGLRILAFARGDLSAMTLIGIVALNDPPRPEVAEAARKAARAGVRTVVITGDHPSTAEFVAREIGLMPRHIVVGKAVEDASDTELDKLAQTVDIIARAAPSQKLRFVQALSARGHVVAMTGDGVNDAPALRAAAIGIAMGKTGTDVAREAADIVLSDDNYATLVSAIEEGRTIYANITKFIFFLLSVNAGLVAAVLVAALLGWPPVLTPTQILWINLVTNGLPALALGMERIDLDRMSRQPRDPNAGFIHRRSAAWIAIHGGTMALAGLGVFRAYGGDLDRARSMAFTVLALAPALYAFSCRSRSRTIVELGVFSNRMLALAACVALALQAVALYVPALSSMFRTIPLSGRDLLVALSLALGVFVLAEAEKIIFRRRPA